MNIKTLLSHRCVALSLLLLAGLTVQTAAHAQTASKQCIELKNEAQTEQAYADAQGKQATRLVTPGKVMPGNEVIYTITVTNVCAKPVSAVVINNVVPEHMSYVMNSAMGVGTEISYSIDGKNFASIDALRVNDANGVSRAAHVEDIKSIRWIYSTTINPGQSGFVRFRATVK